MILAVGNDGQFAQLCRVAAASPSWAADPRFATNALRVRHRGELLDAADAADHARARPPASGSRLLEAAGVPCGPINAWTRCSPTRRCRRAACGWTCRTPSAGSVPLVANPVGFSVSRVDYRRSPPRLGEHFAEVLQ